MEEHSPNIVANVEDKEDNENLTETEPVPEHSILKPKPKKPRSRAQQDAFARRHAARLKPDRVKDMPVKKLVQKLEKYNLLYKRGCIQRCGGPWWAGLWAVLLGRNGGLGS